MAASFSTQLVSTACRLEIHPNRLAGVADQQPLTAMAEADPAQPLIESGRAARRAVQGNVGRPKAQHWSQLLPQCGPAVPVALALGLSQAITPVPLKGGEAAEIRAPQRAQPELRLLRRSRERPIPTDA